MSNDLPLNQADQPLNHALADHSTAIAAIPRPKFHFFTKQNAAENAIKAHEARKQRLEAEQIQRDAEAANALTMQAPADDYRATTLARVRIQLDKIFNMMLAEDDPAKIDRLASAQARLGEQERQLSNRPLPGSLKPTSRSSKSRSDVEPIE
jgi:hypothetical protein